MYRYCTDAALAPLGLRGTQRAILVHIGRLGTPSMGALAGALVLDRSALAHMLKPLVDQGWVTIARNPDDGRERTARLTRRGAAVLAKTAPCWQAAQDRFETALGPRKAAALRAMLAQVAALDLAGTVRREPPGARARCVRPRSRLLPLALLFDRVIQTCG